MTERREAIDRASGTLLRFAQSGGTRSDLLREATRAFAEVSGASRLELFVEDGALGELWNARAQPADVVRVGRDHATHFESLEPWPGGARFVFEISGADRGVVRLDRPSAAFSSSEIEAYQSLAQILGVALASRRAHAALEERVKELTCMYQIAKITAESGLPLEDALDEVVRLLPPAWQHPDRTSARITLGDETFCSRDFAEGTHRLFAPILVRGAGCGQVEVIVGAVVDDDDPFLPEEQHLIEGVARELGSMIERKRAEEEKDRLRAQVQHADRLATVGQLAAGVAHELSEPLANILGFAQLAAKGSQLDEQTHRDLDRIVTASLYAREIIKKLMFFSRPAAARFERANLNAIVEDVLSLLESRLERGDVMLERALSAEPPELRAEIAQIQQILVNLIINALQAMPNGGRLRIETALEHDMVRLRVTDTGAGIAPDHLGSVFVPFFTTKEVGQGTGLGLAVVHGIARGHGGTVEAESALGRGAEFTVRLPRAREDAEP